jgi:hypothetical protein
LEAVQIRLLYVDINRSAIMVNVSVVIALFNDDRFFDVPMITVADDVAVPVTISVTLTNRYANAASTNAHLFRSSRYCAANSSYGCDQYGILNHCVLLSLLNPGKAMPIYRDRSGARSEPGGNKRAQDGARMLYVRLCHRAGGGAADSVIRKSEWSILITTEFSQYDCPGFPKS